MTVYGLHPVQPPEQQPQQPLFPNGRPPTKRKAHPAIVVIVILLVLGGLGGTIGAIASSGNDSGTPPAAPAPATMEAPVASSAPTSDADNVRAWLDRGGENLLGRLGKDSTVIGDVAQSEDYPALAQACHTLRDDIDTAKRYGAAPVASVQTPWGKALATYGRAASDCINGLDRGDQSLITKAGNEITKGRAYLSDTGAAINALVTPANTSVTAGAFCTTENRKAVTTDGIYVTCKSSKTDSHLRWRRYTPNR